MNSSKLILALVGAAFLGLVAIIAIYIIFPPKLNYVRYELELRIDRFANAENVKEAVNKITLPDEVAKGEIGVMARSVALSRSGAAGTLPAHQDKIGFFEGILGSRATPPMFKKKWNQYLAANAKALDAVLAESVSPAAAEKAAKDDMEAPTDLVLAFNDALKSGETLDVYGEREVDAFPTVEALRERIRQFVITEHEKDEAARKDKSSRSGKAQPRTIRVVIRQTGAVVPPQARRFEILVPHIGRPAERVSPGLAESLATIVAPALGKIADIGVRRDDNLNQRLAYAGDAFWKSGECHALLGREPDAGSNPDAGVEELLERLDQSTAVFGFTLPPFDELQMEQLANEAPAKFGKCEVRFFKDPQALRAKIEAEVTKGVGVALVIRPAPHRSLDRVIVKNPVPFRTEASMTAPELRSADGAVMTQWFEVLYVWEKKTGTGANGESVEMLKVGDQEYVGRTAGGTSRAGWVPASDVVPWNGPLVMRFTAPPDPSGSSNGRRPVLFWDDKQACSKLVLQSDADRARAAEELYMVIDRSPDPLPPGIAAVEPEVGIDWEKNPYILPVLEFQRTGSADSGEGLLLKTLSLARKAQAGSRPQPAAGSAAGSAAMPAEGPQIDVVFVMDLTLSMGPWVAPTHAAIESLRSGLLTRYPDVAGRIRFGLWGYRNGFWDTEDAAGNPLREGRERLIPGIGFVTRNFTPELQDAAAFSRTMQSGEVVQTETDSIDYAEDMLAGVHDAITRTQWRAGSARFIILIGDAPGREHGAADEVWLERYPSQRANLGRTVPKGTRSEMDIDSLRGLATESNIYLASIYLIPAKWRAWYERAGKDQFTRLAINHQTASLPVGGNRSDSSATPPSPQGLALHRSISAENANEYQLFMNELVGQIGEQMRAQAVSGSAPVAAPVAAPPAGDGKEMSGAQIAGGLFAAMIKDFRRIGCEQVFEGWVWDSDLVEPAKKPLEPCVLIKASELDSLYDLLDDHIFELRKGKTDQDAFLRGIQSLSAWLMTHFQTTFSTSDLAQAGTSTAYLRGLLPYDSLALSVSAAEWTAKSGSDRARFLSTLEAKVRLYRRLREDKERWLPMVQGAPEDERVMLLPLQHLP